VSTHIAILQQPYADMVLDGRKTIESRLTKVPCPPFGVVAPGERLYLKHSGVPKYFATAVAGEVMSFDGLTPADIDAIRGRWGPAIGGEEAYWAWKRDASYATLIRLLDVEPWPYVVPPWPKTRGRAWHVLPDDQDPMREVRVTGGMLRNGYVSLTTASPATRAGPLTLLMPDGEHVETDFAKGAMLRWRGWRRYFEGFSLAEGDVVRFVAVGPRRYAVTFRPGPLHRPRA